MEKKIKEIEKKIKKYKIMEWGLIQFIFIAIFISLMNYDKVFQYILFQCQINCTIILISIIVTKEQNLEQEYEKIKFLHFNQQFNERINKSIEIMKKRNENDENRKRLTALLVKHVLKQSSKKIKMIDKCNFDD